MRTPAQSQLAYASINTHTHTHTVCHPRPAALCLSPDGRGVPEAHVKLPTELLTAFPAPAGDDARYLQEVAQRGSLDSQ